jgi:hypothetical protein
MEPSLSFGRCGAWGSTQSARAAGCARDSALAGGARVAGFAACGEARGQSASPPNAFAIGGFPMSGKRHPIAAVRCRYLHVRQSATPPRGSANGDNGRRSNTRRWPRSTGENEPSSGSRSCSTPIGPDRIGTKERFMIDLTDERRRQLESGQAVDVTDPQTARP